MRLKSGASISLHKVRKPMERVRKSSKKPASWTIAQNGVRLYYHRSMAPVYSYCRIFNIYIKSSFPFIPKMATPSPSPSHRKASTTTTKLPPISPSLLHPLRTILNNIHKPTIIRITNLINAILSIRPASRTRRVRSRDALQRRRSPIAHARRQRARIAGARLAAREGDVLVADDGEILVAVVEILRVPSLQGSLSAEKAM